MAVIHRSEHDVVVVGARCAGAATAMLLARMGHDVVLVDKARLPTDTLSTHGIARGGVVQLARWDLADEVLATGAPPVEKVTFQADGESVTRRIKERGGVDVLLAPRRYLLDGVLSAAAARSGADLRTGITATGVLRSQGGRVSGITARTAEADELVLSARFVVGADGRQSRMAGHFGAAVLDAFTPRSASFYTYVEASGWDAFEFHVARDAFAGVFPTNDGQACVWLCRPTAATSVLRTAGTHRAEALLTMLDEVAPDLAGRARAGRVMAPVRGAVDLPNYLRTPYGPGWALVGDAGYHRDPITGHGITDAFRDAELLANALDQALCDPSAEADALAAYRRTRDAAVGQIFDLTRALSAYPEPGRFVALQIQLSEALEREADFLAALPKRPEVIESAA